LFHEAVVFALGCGLDRETFRRNTLLAGEPCHRLLWRGFRRTEDALFAIGKPYRQSLGAQTEASWRGVQAHGLVRDFELLEELLQILQRAPDHPIRNFFRTDLKQKRERHCAAST